MSSKEHPEHLAIEDTWRRILTIYSFVETFVSYSLRKALEERNETVPNQLKKQTKTPAARWVFEIFEDVLIVAVNVSGEVYRSVTNPGECS